MTKIWLDHVSVQIPVFTPKSRSLKRDLIKGVGARIQHDREITIVHALNDVSFELKPGDRLGILGLNGSGKSTLLRILARAYEPTAGLVSIEGRSVSLLDLTMGMDPEFSGVENIEIRSELYGFPRSMLSQIISDVIAFSELGEFASLPLRTYSSGMVLRLAFGVATALPPDIILMDELVSVGDRNFSIRARERFDRIITNETILCFASHDLSALKDYCTKGLVLSHGAVHFFGGIDEAIIAYESFQK